MDIKTRLNKILIDISGLDYEKTPEIYTEKLLGKKVGMPARELFQIFHQAEEVFEVKIPEKDILDMKFDTPQHIYEIIERQLLNESSNN